MAKLSMAERKALPLSDFAVPSKAPGPGSFPMEDKAHMQAAKGLSAMHHEAEGAVDRMADKKFGSGLKGLKKKM